MQTKQIIITPDMVPENGQLEIVIRTEQGDIRLEWEGGHMVWVYLPGVNAPGKQGSQTPAINLDLFYMDNEETTGNDGERGPAQVGFFSPDQTDDPLGRIRFYPGQTRVDFEHGAHRHLTEDGIEKLRLLRSDEYIAYSAEMVIN